MISINFLLIVDVHENGTIWEVFFRIVPCFVDEVGNGLIGFSLGLDSFGV